MMEEPVVYYAIMDDDEKIHHLLLKYFESFPTFECKGRFTTASETRDFLMANPVHLLLADVQLPDMDGMDMIESLPDKPWVVFITGHNSKKTATRSYNVDAVHYLTKPISFRDFREAMQRTIQRIRGNVLVEPSLAEYAFFHSGTVVERVLLGDIRYMEVVGNDLTIYLGGGNKVEIRHTLKDAMDRLPERYFMQVHKSYIVSLQHVRTLGPDFVRVYGADGIVPVSRNHRETLKTRVGAMSNKKIQEDDSD